MSQKLLSFLLSGLLIVPTFANLLFAADCHYNDDEDDVEIVIVPEQEESSEPPRTPNTVRIEAWYSFSSSSVRACLLNAGDAVQVECNNLSTGECYSFVISGNGSSVMSISSSAGCWRVSFTLSSGAVYSGEFDLYGF